MNAASLALSNSSIKNNAIIFLCILAGLAPVSCIALHVLNLILLSESVYIIALPAVTITLLIILWNSITGKLILHGWIIGLIAVSLYDCSRIPFILAGWNDFVPHIGNWLLDQNEVNSLIGYIWRYAGSGGGMGITYVFLIQLLNKKSNIGIGILFGIFIFSLLMLTLIIAPDSEKLMFRITPFTFTGSLIGHIIYGGTLGMLNNQPCRKFFTSRNKF